VTGIVAGLAGLAMAELSAARCIGACTNGVIAGSAHGISMVGGLRLSGRKKGACSPSESRFAARLCGAVCRLSTSGVNAKHVLFGAINLATAHRIVRVQAKAGAADAQVFLTTLRARYQCGQNLAAARPGKRAYGRQNPSACSHA
jgi:hypothetical protein